MSIKVNDKVKKAFISKLVASNESNVRMLKVIAALPLSETEKKKQIATINAATAAIKASAKIIEDLLKSLVAGKPNDALLASKIVYAEAEKKSKRPKKVKLAEEVAAKKVKLPRIKKMEAEASKTVQ